MAGTTGVVARIGTFLEMIKFEHTVFALPFAFIGAMVAEQRIPAGPVVFWILVAMVGARTAAMSLNRLIDRHIDRLNPRTANRALVTGTVGVAETWLFIILSFGLLFLAAVMLNPFVMALFPVVVIVLCGYSYTKRFTWACHLVLGAALGFAPVGAWAAVTGSLDWPVIILGLAVTAWVAGFDVIYACQDLDFDRNHGIFSIPARFGLARGLWFARVLHVAAPALLAWAGYLLGMGTWYFAGIAVVVVLLAYEHSLVSPRDLSRLDAAFFAMNGYISVTMFVFTLVDILLK
ncbi:MAG: putative 4-hydroxybenzoate polyprenyltransferase [Heliobacteriaceae bacterium]|nr:putative 4-hydroxybenzoate polyprenyltransferase [Heliobacteriaceae bacterium]MDD4587389.1 putative 4-hydroxybenzoate polyprenyltransferase [Heliobacteriaceae bacterium]